jgi:hypothetical protein
VAALALLGPALVGCGAAAGGGAAAGTSDARYPTLATVTGGVLASSTTDPVGDVPDPATDITAASARLDGRALHVEITLAAAPPATVSGDEQYTVGAYLLRDQNDDAPMAARLLVEAGASGRYLYGPWGGDGVALPGSAAGTTVVLDVPDIGDDVFRYVQFYAEDAAGADAAPDAGANDAAVLPLNPPG